MTSPYVLVTHQCAKQYWHTQAELHMAEGLVFRGEKLVIPTSMHSEMLTKLQKSHLGIEKDNACAPPIMHWPGIGQDKEETMSRCPTCTKYKLQMPGNHSSLMKFLSSHGQSCEWTSSHLKEKRIIFTVGYVDLYINHYIG